MTTRHFGPIQGPGTSVTEKDAERGILPSSTGCAVHVGVFERGMVGMLNYAPKKIQFGKRLGDRLTNGYIAPDAALDFFTASEGAGEMYCVRVTDGNEVAAFEYLYNRRIPRSAVVKVIAHDGGQWAGKRGFIVGKMKTTTVGTVVTKNLTETTLDTGLTMLTNAWAGAVLRIKDVTTKTYVVLSNTVDGVLTVASDCTMLTDYETAGGTSLEYTIELTNGVKYLAAYVTDGTALPTEEWAIKVYYQGVLEYEKDNLSSDPASPHYFLRAINDDITNLSITVLDLWTGSYSADIRPANHFEQLVTLSDTTAKVEIMQYRINSSGGGNATVSGYQYGQSLKKQNLTLTFLSPTTFNVESDMFGALNVAPVSVGALFTPDFGTDYIPKFVVKAGATPMVTDDTISIVVSPLVPNELVGGLIYPDKAGHRRSFYSIISNTVDTVTVKVDSDMLTVADAGTKATVTGSVAAATFDTSTNHVFELTLNGGIEVVVNLTQGATTPIATLATDINTAVGANIATVTADNHLKLTSAIGGRNSKIVIGDGTANATLGFTDAASYAGTAGDCCQLQWLEQLHGGYDGLALLGDADYEAMYDIDTSPIKRLFGKNKGLVKLGTPGVTSPSVQKKGAAFAERMNYQYRYEIPANITEDDQAEAYVNDTLGRNDFAVVAFPSFGYIANPIRGSVGFKLVSLMGSIHGREAKVARDWGGYHKAAAGTDVTLPGVLSLPTGDRALDEEYLNPYGIQMIKQYNTDFIIWGDRTVSVDPQWTWKHQREQMSYYGNMLRENFDWIIFAINDTDTWGLAWTALDRYFSAEAVKRALEGYTIKIDAENNTDATKALGEANCEIRFKFVDTVEKMKFTVSRLGIFEDVGV